MSLSENQWLFILCVSLYHHNQSQYSMVSQQFHIVNIFGLSDFVQNSLFKRSCGVFLCCDSNMLFQHCRQL